MANILVNVRNTTSGSSTGSWATVPGLTASGVTVQSANSVLLLVASIPQVLQSDHLMLSGKH